MTDSKMTGIIPILITPFDSQGRIDRESLESLIDFNINAGVHGLGVANGSEIFKFNETERELVIKIVVDHVRGRVPVVINSGASGTKLAIQYSKTAQELGADALMVIPPFFLPVGAQEISDYYQAIDSEVTIPIFLQDIPQAPVSPSLALRLAENCQNISYIKVETLPSPTKISEIVIAANDILTVFGGAGGSYFIEEMRRGAKGTMPFCSQPKTFVKVWDLFQSGEEAAARQVFNKSLMSINHLEFQGGDLFYHLHKQLLVRLGVIKTAYVRGPTIVLDQVVQKEIDEMIDLLTQT